MSKAITTSPEISPESTDKIGPILKGVPIPSFRSRSIYAQMLESMAIGDARTVESHHVAVCMHRAARYRGASITMRQNKQGDGYTIWRTS